MSDVVAPSAAVVDGVTGHRITGADLHAAVDEIRRGYDELPGGAILLLAPATVATVTRYLAALAARRPVVLLDPGIPAQVLLGLLRRYRPAAVVGLNDAPAAAAAPPQSWPGYRTACAPGLGEVPRRLHDDVPSCHPDLAVLLATSGSTGEPKLVRLSRRGLVANARSIVEALGIDDREVAPTNLPLFYSYGLSVLTSHLLAGATVVVIDGGVLTRGFWTACETHGVTSLAGVPRHYEMLARVRWTPRPQRLRVLTLAGGAMRVDLVRRLHDQMAARGGRLYVMYGQTEATARMTVLPPDRLPDKLGTVGLPVPGGAVLVRDADGRPTDAPRRTGEVLYRGPNVMLGYAHDAADLAAGDRLGGELATGDRGYLDEEGFLTLTGRIDRMVKVFGVRVDLDAVEFVARTRVTEVAAVAGDDRVVVWCARAGAESCRELATLLSQRLRLHPTGFEVRPVDLLPLLANGKIDYARLKRESDDVR